MTQQFNKCTSRRISAPGIEDSTATPKSEVPAAFASASPKNPHTAGTQCRSLTRPASARILFGSYLIYESLSFVCFLPLIHSILSNRPAEDEVALGGYAVTVAALNVFVCRFGGSLVQSTKQRFIEFVEACRTSNFTGELSLAEQTSGLLEHVLFAKRAECMALPPQTRANGAMSGKVSLPVVSPPQAVSLP